MRSERTRCPTSTAATTTIGPLVALGPARPPRPAPPRPAPTLPSPPGLLGPFAGQPVLLPLTESLYVSGTLESVDTVLLEVGTGYYVEVGGSLGGGVTG